MTRLPTSIQKLFQGISDGACISDEKGRIEYLNPAAERLLGTILAESKGKTVCDRLCRGLCDAQTREHAGRCPLRRRGSRRSSAVFEGRYRRKGQDDGLDLSVHCFRLPRSGRTRTHLLTFLLDDSARTTLERRKEDWRTMLVHDLNAPLSNIYAVLRELQDQAPAAGAPDAEIVDIGVQNCRRMMELLQLYLAVARFDACMMPVKSTSLDLAAFVRECAAQQAALACERRIKVVVNSPPALPALGDPQLLARALQNILNNALKFSAENGRVEITAGPDEPGQVRVSVRDTGPGIARADLARIFDRFSQAGRLRRSKNAGIGLGLSFCRQALAAMDGQLTVESRPGEGSLFTLHLPAAAPAPGKLRRS